MLHQVSLLQESVFSVIISLRACLYEMSQPAKQSLLIRREGMIRSSLVKCASLANIKQVGSPHINRPREGGMGKTKEQNGT